MKKSILTIWIAVLFAAACSAGEGWDFTPTTQGRFFKAYLQQQAK